MRSVIRKPLTMLVVEANTAMRAEHGAERRLLLAGEQNRADDGDGRDRVGQRHQRRVQQPRDAPDDVEADERRQHEHEQPVEEIELHGPKSYIIRSAMFVRVRLRLPRSSRFSTATSGCCGSGS